MHGLRQTLRQLAAAAVLFASVRRFHTTLRRFGGPLLCLALALCAGCVQAPDSFKDVCAQAQYQVETCGATVPALKDAPCTGLAEFLSTCVTQQASSCDALAALMRDPSRCFPDAGDSDFPGAEELPLPQPDSPDAGATTP